MVETLGAHEERIVKKKYVKSQLEKRKERRGNNAEYQRQTNN